MIYSALFGFFIINYSSKLPVRVGNNQPFFLSLFFVIWGKEWHRTCQTLHVSPCLLFILPRNIRLVSCASEHRQKLYAPFLLINIPFAYSYVYSPLLPQSFHLFTTMNVVVVGWGWFGFNQELKTCDAELSFYVFFPVLMSQVQQPFYLLSLHVLNFHT